MANLLHDGHDLMRKSRSAPHRQSADHTYRSIERSTSDEWDLDGKSSELTFKTPYRCSSAPANKIPAKRRQGLSVYKPSSRPSTECNSSFGYQRKRSSSLPGEASNQARQHVANRVFFPQSSTIKQDDSGPKSYFDTFSYAFLTRSQEFNKEAFPDVIFPDEFIEQYFDTLAESDYLSAVTERYKPQSCLPYGYTEWTDDDIFPSSKDFFAKSPLNLPSLSPDLVSPVCKL